MAITTQSQLDQFRQYLGRNPTSAEISKASGMSSSQIEAYIKNQAGKTTTAGSSSASSTASTATPASSTSSLESVTGKNVQHGQTWEELQKYVVKDPSSLKDFGLSQFGETDYSKVNEMYDKMVGSLGTSAEEMNKANEALLQGKIPDDVVAQVRQVASEKSSGQGLFGQAGRALSARDLGLQSLQIKQQGIENQAKVSAVQEAAANLSETRRQFMKNYDANLASFQQSVRESNLKGIALEQDRLQFNAKQNMLVLTSLLDLAKSQQDLVYRYMASDMSPTSVSASFDNWIAELRKQLT